GSEYSKLSYHISAGSIEPTQEKIDAITSVPAPKNVDELRTYDRFFPNKATKLKKGILHSNADFFSRTPTETTGSEPLFPDRAGVLLLEKAPASSILNAESIVADSKRDPIFSRPVDGQTFLIAADAMSKWVKVKPTNGSMTAATTIGCLREHIATCGISDKVDIDNSPCFRAEVFTSYILQLEIEVSFAPPYNTSTNGHAELTVEPVKQLLGKMLKNDPNSDLQNNLLTLRSTPSTITGLSPSELLMDLKIVIPLEKSKSASKSVPCNIALYSRQGYNEPESVSKADTQHRIPKLHLNDTRGQAVKESVKEELQLLSSAISEKLDESLPGPKIKLERDRRLVAQEKMKDGSHGSALKYNQELFTPWTTRFCRSDCGAI
ncbi:hypothetical protein B566_EDAN017501, partial [Ephemera danica]